MIETMRKPLRIAACLGLFVASSGILHAGEINAPFAQVPASKVEQSGKVPEGLPEPALKVLANEPDGGNASLILEFDLESVKYPATPLGRLQLGVLERLTTKRAGQKPGGVRGAIHVVTSSADQTAELVGSACVSPAGIPTPYTLDVTRAVSEALARPAGQRKLRLEVQMTGMPAYYEVYGLLTGADKKPPTLEIASPANWTRDWEQRLAPINRGPVVYREACMPIADSLEKEWTVPLLYPARKIIEVIHNGTGEKLKEGRDWVLKDGKLVLPPGSHAPVQLASDFFSMERKNKDGTTKKGPATIRLIEGTWYHVRQMEVTYEPVSRDWDLPAAVSSLDDLPRLKKLLAEKAPIKVVLFGDSISVGGNASKFQAAWPYQPAFGELVAWQLQRHYGSKVTLMNHSRGGAGVAFGASQAASQAGWFKPDLAIIGYGMNDRGDNRKGTYRENLEKIIAAIRQESPATEFIVVTSMLNNPKQPSGLEPVQFLRDEALKISLPGLAFADMTSTHLELIKHKDYLATSGNGANHPNDFLQRIYAQRILEILIPDKASKPGK